MVVCLMIAKSPKAEYLDHYASRIPLMNCSHLPAGEPKWTCRVWVKETLKALHEKGQIVLPADVGQLFPSSIFIPKLTRSFTGLLDTIESYGKYTADRYLAQMGNPMIFNDLGWLSQTTAGNTQQQYYGAEPMETETYHQYQQQRYYGTKPMQTETYGQTARQYKQQTYYGTKPMQTETYQYNTYY